MRLIDADALKENMKKAEEQADTFEMLVEFYEQIINNAPTVPLFVFRERPQGKWIKHDTWDYSCSICEETSTVDDGIVEDLPNFCPNCGAQMQRLEGGRE